MTKPLKIIVSGANGRMGKSIIQLISKDDSVKLVGASEYSKSLVLGVDAGLNAKTQALNCTIKGTLNEALTENKGVIIDFSSIEATLNHVKVAQDTQTPIVIGTTGFNTDQINQIKKSAQKIPIVLAPNMSVGMNLMFKLVADAGKVLNDDYDIEILEAHHKHKKDAPSGTAVRLAKALCDATNRNYPDDLNYHRQGITGARTKKEIGMQVIRGGDIVGEHTVFYCGEGERIEIKHTATNRDTFAKGSIRAAKWLADKKSDLYDMWDVLGIG